MAGASRVRLSVRSVVAVALAAAVGAFVVAKGPVLVAAVRGVGHASPLPLALGIVLSAVSMANRGGLNRAAHRAAGLDAPPLTMIRPAAVGFTADKVVRAGGVGGLAVFVRHGAERSYPRGAVIGACVLAATASFAALGLLLTATVVLLAAAGRLTGWWLVAGTGFAIYAAVAATGFVVVGRRRDFADRIWSVLSRRATRLTRGTGAAANPVDDISAALATARRNRRWAGRTMTHALAAKALGAGMLLTAAVAAGVPITITRVVVVYATALFASMVSLSPAGLGVVEASTGALLASAGGGVAAAAAAVALYRLFDLWIPVIVGALAARRRDPRPGRGAGVSGRPAVSMRPVDLVPA